MLLWYVNYFECVHWDTVFKLLADINENRTYWMLLSWKVKLKDKKYRDIN